MNSKFNISIEEYEQIEAYLEKKMGPDERIKFEQQIATDAGWQEKIEEVRLLITGIKEVRLQTQLDELHKSVVKPKAVLRTMNIARVAVAATLIAFAVLATWWYTNKPATNEGIYHAYYSPDPGLMTTMGITDDYNFQKAMVDYKSKDYDAALTAWLSLEPTRPNNDTLRYFIGAAYQAKGNDEKAIGYLEPITKNASHSFYKDACWYLGLIWVRKGEFAEARRLLEISGNALAPEILKKLK